MSVSVCQMVESITKFTYLGSDIISDGWVTSDVYKQIRLASSIMGQLDAVWRHSRLSLTVKLRLYTSLVQSVLLYGSEA